mgnify:CR=1 FL=1
MSSHTSSEDKLLKIGEVAERTGLGVGTIRYYESLGLVAPTQRSESNYRSTIQMSSIDCNSLKKHNPFNSHYLIFSKS